MAPDVGFAGELRRAVVRDVRAALAEPVVPDERHRVLMERAKLFVAAYCWPGTAYRGDDRLIAAAEENLRALRALQGGSGLFIGGDNVDSPPDSSFTVNDVCDTLQIIRLAGEPEAAALAGVAATLDAIADAVEPALIAGGVHTPNHRWEISAALARLHRRRPSAALRARAEEWLAEGVDITPDGVYSERSANYAAYVSNPSLTVVADEFGRDDARAAVIRNLDSTLGLLHPDDTVETVHSRRQDQLHRFPLAPYLTMLRHYAIELGRGDLAWAARRALRGGVVHPSAALAELLLDPRLGEELPDSQEPAAATAVWEQSALAVDATDRRRLVVYGGSDYGRFRRVRSGLANNPTFLRMFAGAAILDSVRLSRDFFGLGPFRPEGLEIGPGDDGAAVYSLAETVAAHYYQPLAPGLRDPSGAYDLTDDGRFFGSMAFADRETDDVALRTEVEVRPSEDGAVVEIALEGPDCAWALELAFREGGRFEGAEPIGEGIARLTAGAARYRHGDDVIVVDVGDAVRTPSAARYHPGEDYAFLGATDAAGGPRLYVTGRAPGRVAVAIRAETSHP